jgi:hypothetical protein
MQSPAPRFSGVIGTFVRGFAAAGNSVLVSSHVLAEVAQTVDRVVIIDKGRLVTIAQPDELAARVTGGVRVRAPRIRSLLPQLELRGFEATLLDATSSSSAAHRRPRSASSHAAPGSRCTSLSRSRRRQVFQYLPGVARYAPAAAGTAMTGDAPGDSSVNLLTAPVGGALLAVYAAAFAMTGGVVTSRRDVT